MRKGGNAVAVNIKRNGEDRSKLNKVKRTESCKQLVSIRRLE